MLLLRPAASDRCKKGAQRVNRRPSTQESGINLHFLRASFARIRHAMTAALLRNPPSNRQRQTPVSSRPRREPPARVGYFFRRTNETELRQLVTAKGTRAAEYERTGEQRRCIKSHALPPFWCNADALSRGSRYRLTSRTHSRRVEDVNPTNRETLGCARKEASNLPSLNGVKINSPGRVVELVVPCGIPTAANAR